MRERGHMRRMELGSIARLVVARVGVELGCGAGWAALGFTFVSPFQISFLFLFPFYATPWAPMCVYMYCQACTHPSS